MNSPLGGESSAPQTPENAPVNPMRKYAVIAAVGLMAVAGCSSRNETPAPQVSISAEQSPSAPSPITPTAEVSPVPTAAPQSPETGEASIPDKGLLEDPVALERASMVISTFENSTPEIQYDYAEHLKDGRGITAGRSGFCSGTGDMLLVIEKYAEKHPESKIAKKYLKRLKAIDKEFAASNWEKPVGSTKGLKGLEKVWENTSKNDPDFHEAQDAVFNDLYLKPALEAAGEVNIADTDGKGISTSLGQLIILDTALQHGTGTDPDGLKTIMAETAKAVGSNPSEKDYLSMFLSKRREHLENAANPDTREAWKDAVDRVEVLRKLLDSGNTNLREKMEFAVYGDPFLIPAAE